MKMRRRRRKRRRNKMINECTSKTVENVNAYLYSLCALPKLKWMVKDEGRHSNTSQNSAQ